MKPVPLAALALVGAGLAATIAWEFRPSAPEQDGAATPPNATALPAATQAMRDDGQGRVAAVKTVLARPLFSPTRRPPAVAAAATVETRGAALPRMTAILIDGRMRSAIFAATGGGKPSVIPEGGHLGAFTIQSIEPQQVTIIGPEGKRVVRTSFDPNPPAPAPQIQPSLPPGLAPNGIPSAIPNGILGLPGAAPGAVTGVAR